MVETRTWHLIIFLNLNIILQYFNKYKVKFPHYVLNLTYHLYRYDVITYDVQYTASYN